MRKEEVQTPAIAVDIDILERNIETYHKLAKEHGKEIWPMLKTHKSTEIMRRQIEAGATGVLCGTIDEAEAAAELGVKRIMYAYPVANKENLRRIIEIGKKYDVIIRLDDADTAAWVDREAREAHTTISCTIIVDVGLHRFGLLEEHVLSFANTLTQFPRLKMRGISAHAGHVYAATSPEEVQRYAQDEIDILGRTAQALAQAGYKCELVTSGTTPTFRDALKSEAIGIYHPGNYVFHDVIQMSLGVAKAGDCALYVIATVLSNPRPGEWMIDAGSKCLGLDLGAHGNDSIKGHGLIKGHPDATLVSLSEEVGKIVCKDEAAFAVGDRLDIIPNHACSTANMTDHLIAMRGEKTAGTIPVDIRGNKTKKNVLSVCSWFAESARD